MDNAMTWDDLLSVIQLCLSDSQLNTSTGSASSFPASPGSAGSSDALSFRDFKKVVFELAVKKYKDKLQDANVLCFEHLVDENIRKNFDEDAFFDEDPALDCVTSSQPLIRLLGKHRKQLQELFSVFSTIHVLSSQSPSWDEIVKFEYGVSIAEFIMFAQCFELTPASIPRHAISRKIVPPSFHGSAGKSAQELATENMNLAEFSECLARMAIHIFSKYPYSVTLRTADEQLAALFERLGFFDRKKFAGYLKKSGLGTQNKTQKKNSSKKNQQHQQQNYNQQMNEFSDDLLRDKDRLKDELQRIFMYYCSFGDHLNLELMGSSKFSKFVKDIKVISKGGVKIEDVDLIFVDVMRIAKKRSAFNASSGGGGGASAIGALGPGSGPAMASYSAASSLACPSMTFDVFLEALQVIACRHYGGEDQDSDRGRIESLVRLILQHVLPYAQRVEDKFTSIDPSDPATMSLLSSHRKQLQAIFLIFGSSDGDQNSQSMSINELQRLATQFDMVPAITSKSELNRIFRSTFIDRSMKKTISANEDISFAEFEQCIIRIAAIGYSKHPYGVKYPTLDAKVEALLTKMGLPDWEKIRKRLAAFGHKVPNSPLKVMARLSQYQQQQQQQQTHGYHHHSGATTARSLNGEPGR